jgi:hypothetical protein
MSWEDIPSISSCSGCDKSSLLIRIVQERREKLSAKSSKTSQKTHSSKKASESQGREGGLALNRLQAWARAQLLPHERYSASFSPSATVTTAV